jgi:hypothetical protein
MLLTKTALLARGRKQRLTLAAGAGCSICGCMGWWQAVACAWGSEGWQGFGPVVWWCEAPGVHGISTAVACIGYVAIVQHSFVSCERAA